MANNNRFADAIKRIVEPLIPKKEGDDPATSKTPITGRRGIAYGTLETESGAVGSASRAVGTTASKTKTEGLLQPEGSDELEEAAIEEALSTIGAMGGEQGKVSADDLLNEIVNPGMPGTVEAATLAALAKLGAENGAGTQSGGGRVTEITGLKDCTTDTGQTFSVRFDGNYTPPSGLGDPDNPDPTNTGWDSAYFWTGTNFAGSSQGSSMYEAGNNQMQGTVGYVSPGQYQITAVRYVGTNYLIGTSTANYNYEYYADWGTGHINTGWVSGTINVSRSACTGEGNPSVYCTLTEDTRLSFVPWSNEDFNFQLSRVIGADAGAQLRGQFAPIKNDTSVPHKYRPPRSTVVACTEGGAHIEITTLSDGGFAFYETSGGTPTGTIRLFNADGSVKGFTDAAGLINYLP